MSPEQVTEMLNRIKALELTIKSYEQADQVDPQYARTLGEIISTSSGKTAASATQSVNEGGSGTYDVMVPPDGFIKIGDKNVPYIN